MNTAADSAPVVLRVELNTIDPPQGSIDRERPAQQIHFRGWISFISAVDTLARPDSPRVDAENEKFEVKNDD